MTNVGEGIYSVSIIDVNNCSTSFNQLIIDSDCVAFIVQQNNTVISTQVYQVAQYIQSNGIVTINQSVNYYAGDYIELTNDFEVIQGAEFEAKIGGCQ